MRNVIIAGLLLSLCTGCITPSYKSFNAQRAALRGTADISTTIALDTCNTPAEAQYTADKTRECVTIIRQFLADGSAAALSTQAIQNALYTKVPVEYQWLVSTILSYAPSITAPCVGSKACTLMVAVCDGIITATTQYRVTDRAIQKAVSTQRSISRARSTWQFRDELTNRLDSTQTHIK